MIFANNRIAFYKKSANNKYHPRLQQVKPGKSSGWLICGIVGYGGRTIYTDWGSCLSLQPTNSNKISVKNLEVTKKTLIFATV